VLGGVVGPANGVRVGVGVAAVCGKHSPRYTWRIKPLDLDRRVSTGWGLLGLLVHGIV
jgi:hypothetical protein